MFELEKKNAFEVHVCVRTWARSKFSCFASISPSGAFECTPNSWSLSNIYFANSFLRLSQQYPINWDCFLKRKWSHPNLFIVRLPETAHCSTCANEWTVTSHVPARFVYKQTYVLGTHLKVHRVGVVYDEVCFQDSRNPHWLILFTARVLLCVLDAVSTTTTTTVSHNMVMYVLVFCNNSQS